jgi:DNA-binding NtrC family response regulator
VLLVDDEESVRTVVETMLARAGFPVLCARGGPEGVERLRAHPAAVGALILNLTMPGMSGEQVLEEIDSIRPGLKVIVCTGYPEEEARARFGRRHIDGFIRKPFAMETLLTMVGRFFGPPPRQR